MTKMAFFYIWIVVYCKCA